MLGGGSAVQPVAPAGMEREASGDAPLPPSTTLSRLQLPDVSLRSLWTGLFGQVGGGLPV